MIWINPDKCPQDRPCPAVQSCAHGALQQQGVRLPFIERRKCVNCKRCIQRCPYEAIEEVTFG